MQMKIALFRSPYTSCTPCGEWAAGMSDYAQLTEFVEIDFPELSPAVVVANQIAVLDRMADEVRTKAADRLLVIEQQKAELLALPAPDNRGPDEPDPYLYGDEDTGEDCNVEAH